MSNIPILGICYGLQLITVKFGGEVKIRQKREYGRTLIKSVKKSDFVKNFFEKTEKLRFG